jgi:hypothetical protein
MMTVNTDRMKVLQMTRLSMMRAMRAVCCRTLRQKIVLLAALRSTTSEHISYSTTTY